MGRTLSDLDTASIKQQFERTFGPSPVGRASDAAPTVPAARKVHVVRAPGRVNLIGEHTDYNEGFVFPMAIEPEVRVVCRARDDGRVRLATTAPPYDRDLVEFSVQQRVLPPPSKEHVRWSDYPRGVIAELIAAGIPVVGMDALYTNTLPTGSGLSSSAAMEVSTAVACLALAGLEMDPNRLALICQKAEHEFAHVPSGIMDQTIVACGRAGRAMLLDCRDLSKQFVPIDSRDLRVVIVNSMVKHALTGGEYAERRRQCEEGVAYFRRKNPAVRALRDVSMREVEEARSELPGVVFRRCRHVVGENARTTTAAQKLAQLDYESVGELMGQSHNSLRDDYEVSTQELDFLVEQSVQVKGVYGARMTGGGFGGCIVALAQPRAVEPLEAHLKRVYPEKFRKEPAVYVTTATQGASVLE
jgi:galactokinase